MDNLFIVGTSNLYYGNSASVTRMNNYARSLAAIGVQVYIVSVPAFNENSRFYEVEPGIFALKQCRKKFRGNDVSSVSAFIKQFKTISSEMEGRKSILNYSSTESLLLDWALLRAFRRHNLYCEVNEVRKFASGMQNTIRTRLYNYLLERTYREYDGIIFISRIIQQFYSDYTDNSIVVPILSDCRKPFKESSGIGSMDIIFAGTVSFAKENLEELLEGFLLFVMNHRYATLSFYGSISREDLHRLDVFVRKNGLSDRIKYKGECSHDNILEVFSKAGALVLPRTNNSQNKYGFSTKLSEYAVSGAPIIMTNTGVVGDYFQDGVNCLMCDGYDRHAFKAKLEEWALMSVEDRERIARNSYITASKCFDYNQYSSLLYSFFFGNN